MNQLSGLMDNIMAVQISGGWHDKDISKKSLPAE